MSSGDRFYQFSFPHRPAMRGDIGSLLKIEGLVIGGCGAQGVLTLPGIKFSPTVDALELSAEEWSDWLQRSDVPEILVSRPPGMAKVFHRKTRWEISGATQQKVWFADGCKCVFCKRPMGEIQLTVDHFFPLELGGQNDVSNYLSACRKCNKSKGSEDPRIWCGRNGYDFDSLARYLELRTI